ncbi:MAG: hypothetical protein ABI639_13975 [Thermoanaerobaculia bacterium]
MNRSRPVPTAASLVLRLSAVFALGAVPSLFAQGHPTTGPDVTVINIDSVSSYGGDASFMGYAVGTTSCNIGNIEVNWCNTGGCGGGLTNHQHPVIAQNLYRLKDGRFTQIGMSWLKHGFFATNKEQPGLTCKVGTSCIPPPLGSKQLGIGCTDTYWADLNGDRALGRRSEIEPTQGTVTVYPYVNTGFSASYDQRVKVPVADVNPALNAGAVYWAEGQYISDNDAAAGNGLNNASFTQVNVGGDSAFSLSMVGSTVREHSALYGWKALDPTVEIFDVDVPGAIAERFEVARKVTAIDVDTWHYEYAIGNVNSDRSARAFTVTFAGGTPIANAGFHDVDSHSGEPYSTADWTASVPAGVGTVTWSTATFASDPNANALRWSTTYSFWFDADAAPSTALQSIELFKPGSPGSVSWSMSLYSDGFEAHNLTAWSSSIP